MCFSAAASISLRSSETDEDTQFELPRIVPAWRFGGPGSGMVECLLRGVSGAATGQFVAPRVAFDDDARHLIAALPSPRYLSPGRYSVRCVQIYGADIRMSLTHETTRWENWREGAPFEGKVLASALESQQHHRRRRLVRVKKAGKGRLNRKKSQHKAASRAAAHRPQSVAAPLAKRPPPVCRSVPDDLP